VKVLVDAIPNYFDFGAESVPVLLHAQYIRFFAFVIKAIASDVMMHINYQNAAAQLSSACGEYRPL